MVRVGARVGWCALALLVACGLGREALACGGGGLTTNVINGVVADAQRVFMSVSGGRTEVVVQVGVPASTSGYGVLIPVPGEPTLDPEPVDASDLVALDTATTPVVLDVDESSSDSSSGCGCIAMGASDGQSAKGGGEPGEGVSVTELMNIGPVSAVVLRGTSADAVNEWLADNRFVIPEAERPIIGQYVGADRYFIAIRRSNDLGSGGPSSIGLHYSLPGDHRMLSLGFARLGAAPSVAFTLFLATPKTLGADAPFETLSLNQLDAALLRTGSYRTAVASAVSARSSRAFVIESATTKLDLSSRLTPRIADMLAPDAIVSRLSTVIEADALTEDATFTTPYLGSVPNERYVSAPHVPRSYAGFGALFALSLAGALRRGPRRRS